MKIKQKRYINGNKVATSKNDILQSAYQILSDRLDEIKWQLEPKTKCEDIDCTSYVYRDCLKKGLAFPLEHGYSCVPKLKEDRKALMLLLNDKKFRKFRYKPCDVCKRSLDTLDDKKYKLLSFIAKEPHTEGKKKIKLWRSEMFRVHKRCVKKVKTPEGYEDWGKRRSKRKWQ